MSDEKERITPTEVQLQEAFTAIRTLQRNGVYIPQVSLPETGIKLIRSYVTACLGANGTIFNGVRTEEAQRLALTSMRSLVIGVLDRIFECFGTDTLMEAELATLLEVMRVHPGTAFDQKVINDIFAARFNIPE